MERSRIAAALAVALVVCGMTTAAAQSPPATSFRDCYIPCFILCIVIPPHSVIGCSLDCLKSCIIPQAPHAAAAAATHPETRLLFCKLGCASSLCANISTRQNPGGEKVESCVGSCSGLCTSN